MDILEKIFFFYPKMYFCNRFRTAIRYDESKVQSIVSYVVVLNNVKLSMPIAYKTCICAPPDIF